MRGNLGREVEPLPAERASPRKARTVKTWNCAPALLDDDSRGTGPRLHGAGGGEGEQGMDFTYFQAQVLHFF